MPPTAYRRNARGLRDRQAFEHVGILAAFTETAPQASSTSHAPPASE